MALQPTKPKDEQQQESENVSAEITGNILLHRKRVIIKNRTIESTAHRVQIRRSLRDMPFFPLAGNVAY